MQICKVLTNKSNHYEKSPTYVFSWTFTFAVFVTEFFTKKALIDEEEVTYMVTKEMDELFQSKDKLR